MTVDVDKLRCNFVHEVYRYITCGKYSVDCCYTNAARAFQYYKLATFTDCEVPVEIQCFLSELNTPNYIVGCTEVTLDCDGQVSAALSKVTQSCLITNTLSNPVDSSQFPRINVLNDESYMPAVINILSNSTCGETAEHLVTSGSYLVNDVAVFDERFNPHVRVILDLDNIANGGYILNLEVYETVNANSLNPVPISIDTNPTTSPYLSCGGCTVVNPSELYFGHPNFINALTTLLRNAMLTIYGDADLGDFQVVTKGKGYRISSLVKHNPSNTWVGLSKGQSIANYSPNGLYTISSNSNATGLEMHNTFMQVKYQIPLVTCSTLDVIVQGMITFDLNYSASNMHQFVLSNPNSTTALAFSTVTSAICPKITLTALVTPVVSGATQVWRDPGNVIISTTNTAVVEDVGTYTFTVTLPNGCAITDTITV